jgi:hypothetical protein
MLLICACSNDDCMMQLKSNCALTLPNSVLVLVLVLVLVQHV